MLPKTPSSKNRNSLSTSKPPNSTVSVPRNSLSTPKLPLSSVSAAAGEATRRANAYGNDRDVIKGQDGFDLIYVDDGDTLDRIFGGKGNDRCYMDARSEVVSGYSRIIVQ